MPRPRKPWWNEKDHAYYTKLEGRQTMLRRPDGSKVGHGDERGVREAVDRLMAEHDALVRRAADPTVNDICREYLIACSHEATAETMVGKEWILTKFCEFGDPPFGGIPAGTIDSTHLHRMRKAWEKDGYAGGMLRRLYQEVRACWAWAARPEPERTPLVILAKNPLAGMRLPAGSPSKAKYVPLGTTEAIIAFAQEKADGLQKSLGRFEQQAVLMLRLLAETGCRPKEACTALWADLMVDDGLIVLDPSRHKSGKKTGKPRVIVVPRVILADIVTLRDSGYAHPTHVFAHRRSSGEPSKTAKRETGIPWLRPSYTAWFRRLIRAAREEWQGDTAKPEVPKGMTLYWLRHSYLTDAQIGEGSERAADLAGNTKEMARGTYFHVQADQLRASAERVAARRNGGKPPLPSP